MPYELVRQLSRLPAAGRPDLNRPREVPGELQRMLLAAAQLYDVEEIRGSCHERSGE
jgi:hypothetical protein